MTDPEYVTLTKADMGKLREALSELPLEYPDAQGPTLTGAVGRKCRRHEWMPDLSLLPDGVRLYANVESPYHALVQWRCNRCGVFRDEAKAKRGKSSRRLGNDQERRAERRYGFRKVGEFGGITDLQGRTTKVQMKSTRAAPPLRWKAIFARLEEVADGRMPALLFSFVRQGLPVEDFFIVRGKDWLDWRGRDDESE